MHRYYFYSPTPPPKNKCIGVVQSLGVQSFSFYFIFIITSNNNLFVCMIQTIKSKQESK